MEIKLDHHPITSVVKSPNRRRFKMAVYQHNAFSMLLLVHGVLLLLSQYSYQMIKLTS